MADLTLASVASRRSRNAVALWLLVVCAIVFAMVVLGGVTRLTHSGLSIVEWRPITGVLPPLSDSAWQDAFTRYQQFPEYQQINRGMTLPEFKSIFWFEFSHRLLGRAVGIVFLVPFLFFWFTGRLDRAFVPKLLIMFALGAAQGLLGWYMVKSGLADRPDVSQYRLTAHLGLAVAIYGYMMWVALGALKTEAPPEALSGAPLAAALRSSPGGWLRALTVWIFVVILSGGLVAGLDAGFAYNTFPLMDGAWIPPGLFDAAPWFLNFFENRLTVQFDHRVLAVLTVIFAAVLWARGRNQATPEQRLALDLILAAVALQFVLGLLTLWLVVPVAVAAMHQAGALVLFTAAIYAAHAYRESPVRRAHP